MKKTLIALCALFIISFGCKKIDDEGMVCGCSPVHAPAVFLSIKNETGTDLLNKSNAGAYSKTDIQVYQKDPSGQTTPLQSIIREPFDYGNKRFESYSLLLPLDIANQSGNSTYYLKLKTKEHLIKVQLTEDKSDIASLLIDGQTATTDNTDLKNYAKMFYLVQQEETPPL